MQGVAGKLVMVDTEKREMVIGENGYPYDVDIDERWMRENLGEQMGAIVKSGVIERIWRIGEEEPPPLSKEFSEVFPEGVK